MKFLTLFISGAIAISACSSPRESHEELVASVRLTEQNFAALAASEGLQRAFTEFAHPDAVLNRGELIRGVDSISEFYGDEQFTRIRLKWEPSFIDVAESGDLAYTYGPYEMIRTDSSGTAYKSQGFFHTVWKRMPDGSWKYVYD